MLPQAAGLQQPWGETAGAARHLLRCWAGEGRAAVAGHLHSCWAGEAGAGVLLGLPCCWVEGVEGVDQGVPLGLPCWRWVGRRDWGRRRASPAAGGCRQPLGRRGARRGLAGCRVQHHRELAA